jgi:hypothetical protein
MSLRGSFHELHTAPVHRWHSIAGLSPARLVRWSGQGEVEAEKL